MSRGGGCDIRLEGDSRWRGDSVLEGDNSRGEGGGYCMLEDDSRLKGVNRWGV